MRTALPELLAAHADEIAESIGLPQSLLTSLGVVPSYYLRYFYAHDEVVREQLAGTSRAAEVAEIERRLLELYADPALDEKPELLARRGGAYYSEAAVQLAAALLGDGSATTHVVNVRNAGTLPFLPDDSVVEVPASVDRSGVRALPVSPLEPLYAGLVGHVTAYEHLALEAALHGGRRARLRRAPRAPVGRSGRPRRRPHRPAARPQPEAPAMGLIDAVLAIDAGNSKTDVCVVSADGGLLGSARGGPFRPHLVGAVPAVAAITPAVEAALAIAGSPELRHVAACLANADLPVEHAALEAAIARAGWHRRARRRTRWSTTPSRCCAPASTRRAVSRWSAARGSTAPASCRTATTVRFAAVGHISGDWGGGGHLWQEAMWWAARAEDGRGPETALRTALPRYHGLDSMAALIEAVHVGTISEERCLALTPLLFEVADAGDPVAMDVVRRQAEEVVALAAAAIRRLGVIEEPIDVVLGGGVLTAGHQGLISEIVRRLAEEAPKAVARVVEASPILGAALLGLDRIGATRDAQDRLRAEFRGVPQSTATPTTDSSR